MKTYHLLFALSMLFAATYAAVSFAATTTDEFVTKVSIANRFEIDSSKLALQKSKNPAVKTFAQRMIDDHMKAGAKLKNILQASKNPLKVEDELDEEHQNLLNTLESATSSEAFDRQYVALQTDAHQKAVSLFTDYAASGQDAALKSFANEMLPALKQHLQQVQQIKLDTKGA